MHSAVLPVLLGALGLVQAQKIDLDKIASYPGPQLVSAPFVTKKDTPERVAAPAVKAIPVSPQVTAKATAVAALDRRERRRPRHLAKRDGDCAPEPAGKGPVPDPDTAEAFVTYSSLQVRTSHAMQ